MKNERYQCFISGLLVGMLIVAAGSLGALPSAAAAADADPAVYINEIQVSTSGTDWEFVELWGEPGTDLSGLTFVGVESDDTTDAGTIDLALSLDGQEIPTDGFWLGISPEGSSEYGISGDLSFNNNSLENSTATYLLVTGFTGAVGNDLDTDNDGTLNVTPWAKVIDAVNVRDDAGDFDYGVTSVGPDGPFLPSGTYRCPDAPIGTFGNLHNFSTPNGTPGATNSQCPLPTGKCREDATLISAVQGVGATSPLEGEKVVIEGVVVGDFQWGGDDDGDLGGFHVQEEKNDEDSDPMTSEGVFVYDGGFGVDVAVGDRVRVNGVASEYHGLTQLGSLSDVLVCDHGSIGRVTPASVSLPVADTGDLEAYEGMSVVISQPLVISEFYNFDRYGEIVLTTERQFQPTAIYGPGSPQSSALAEANRLSRIQLDDGRTSQNPDPALHPNGAEFDLTNRFRGGDILQNVTGVMGYSFGAYEIHPTAGADYTSVNERPAVPSVGGDIKVASFNVLNYFTTLDGSGDICGPTGGQECRGADDVNEFTRQRTKIVEALCAIDADVFGLMELENQNPDNDPEPGDSIDNYVLKDLVGALNDAESPCPDKTYGFTDSSAVGTDAIRQGIIYKTDVLTPIGRAVLTDAEFVDPNELGDPKNRPAIAETFEDSSGESFTVVVNHLKSKGSPCGAGDDDPQAGNCNLTRTLAAEELVDWLATDPTGSGDGDFLILGDLNSYDKEDPIDVLKAGGYTDLVFNYEGEYAYSYVFDGQLGYLDYGMANEALLPQVTGTAVWHINADEPDILDYDTSYKRDPQDALYEENPYRSSDHDPVIIGLDLPCTDDTPPTLNVTVSLDRLWPPNHKYTTIVPTVEASDNVDPDPRVTLISAVSDEPDIGTGDGDMPDDIVINDDGSIDLRAERSGTGDGRVYTLTYRATDACGNNTEVTVMVTAPLSNSRGR